MRGTKMAFLWTFAAVAALAMLLPLAAQAEIVYQGDYYRSYIRFTAGSSLTIKVSPPPSSSTGSKIIYDWKWDDYNGGDADLTPIETTSVPSLTITPTASDHRKMISLDIFEEGNKKGGITLEFDLLDSSIPYPIVPQEGGYFEYDLFLGESVTLAVPEATADVSGKTLVYEWFREMPDGGDELAQRGSSNTLTVTSDGKQDFWSGYFCRVFYQEDENSEIYYNSYFSVNFYDYKSEKYKIDGDTYRTVANEEVAEVPTDIGKALGNENMTVVELKAYVFDELNKNTSLNLKQEMARLYDVKLQTQDEDGQWVQVTENTFPENGLLVMLPYPEGTDQWNYEFKVAHVFEGNSRWGNPGDIEYPHVEKTAHGLKVRLKGLSPVMVAWEPASSVPVTGDSMPLGCIAALLAASVCVMAALGWMLRRRRT